MTYIVYLYGHGRLPIERSIVVEIKLKTPGDSCHLNLTKEYVAGKNIIFFIFKQNNLNTLLSWLS